MFIQNRLGYLFVLWSTSALLYLYSELIVQHYARYIFTLWRLTLIQTYWWTGRKTPTYLLNLLLWRPYGEGIADKINVLSAENYWLTGRKTQSYLLDYLMQATEMLSEVHHLEPGESQKTAGILPFRILLLRFIQRRFLLVF